MHAERAIPLIRLKKPKISAAGTEAQMCNRIEKALRQVSWPVQFERFF